ncbi:MAG: hypothetical protein AAGF98_15795 [Cyanobacteria bacterium P01_H01_bin.153]
MKILQDIKIGRLVIAIVITVLIADTVPHPNLSAGLLDAAAGAIAESNL